MLDVDVVDDDVDDVDDAETAVFVFLPFFFLSVAHLLERCLMVPPPLLLIFVVFIF